MHNKLLLTLLGKKIICYCRLVYDIFNLFIIYYIIEKAIKLKMFNN